MATSKSLVIVESPAKAKTIEKYLGKGFEVRASVGHIMDLPKNDIGVELEKRTFEPELIVSPGKEKVVEQLKKAGEKADGIYLAADPDREGEAIAYLALQPGHQPKSGRRSAGLPSTRLRKRLCRTPFSTPGMSTKISSMRNRRAECLTALLATRFRLYCGIRFDVASRLAVCRRLLSLLIVEREREIGVRLPAKVLDSGSSITPGDASGEDNQGKNARHRWRAHLRRYSKRTGICHRKRD